MLASQALSTRHLSEATDSTCCASTIALVAILFDSSDIKGDTTKALRSIIDEEFIPADLEVGIIRTDGAGGLANSSSLT